MRDADGRLHVATDRETLVERLIREAQERGEFDDLPLRGRPIPVEEHLASGDMALAHHVLRNAGAAPPWIEADREVRERRAACERLIEHSRGLPPARRDARRRQLAALADAHDATVASLNGVAPSERLQRRPLDRERFSAALERAMADREPRQ
jgi:hypothetical protein